MKPWKGISITTYNNSWQWAYTTAEPFDVEDPHDHLHRHPRDPYNSITPINVGQTYEIQMIIRDGTNITDGQVIFSVDGIVKSDQYYQTKSPTETHYTQWGAYWSNVNKNGYNSVVLNKCADETGLPDVECKSLQFDIDNLTISERTVLQ